MGSVRLGGTAGNWQRCWTQISSQDWGWAAFWGNRLHWSLCDQLVDQRLILLKKPKESEDSSGDLCSRMCLKSCQSSTNYTSSTSDGTRLWNCQIFPTVELLSKANLKAEADGDSALEWWWAHLSLTMEEDLKPLFFQIDIKRSEEIATMWEASKADRRGKFIATPKNRENLSRSNIYKRK